MNSINQADHGNIIHKYLTQVEEEGEKVKCFKEETQKEKMGVNLAI